VKPRLVRIALAGAPLLSGLACSAADRVLGGAPTSPQGQGIAPLAPEEDHAERLAPPGTQIDLKRSVTLAGISLGEGVGLGHVVLHEPRVVVTALIGEDADAESARLDAAIASLRLFVDGMLSQTGYTGQGVTLNVEDDGHSRPREQPARLTRRPVRVLGDRQPQRRGGERAVVEAVALGRVLAQLEQPVVDRPGVAAEAVVGLVGPHPRPSARPMPTRYPASSRRLPALP